jgi:parvulin-like peptidyl-prolyl isomerase
MHRSMKFAALLIAGALTTAACADASVVASVNDAPIEGSDVTALRVSFQDTATLVAEDYRSDLTNLIFIEAEKDAAAEDFGLTDLDDPDGVEQMLADPGPLDAQVLEAVQTDPDRTEASMAVLAEALIIREEVTRALLVEDETMLRDLFANRPGEVTHVCVRHILVATEEEAETARERVEAGEEFATVATEVSLDTASRGGERPCPTAAATYVEAFALAAATAPLGEITEPFETEFGWHILVVDERVAPGSIEDLVADPLLYLDSAAANERFVAWLQSAVARAHVEVRSQVGEWVPEANGIAPPPSG